MCNGCYEAWMVEEGEKRKRAEDEARQWIKEFSVHTQNAFTGGIILKSFGIKRIDSISQDCKYILDHIDEWRKYDKLETVLSEFIYDDENLCGWVRCSLFPESFFRKGENIDLVKEFSKLNDIAEKRKRESISVSFKAYDYAVVTRVAGVTFKNEDGRKRQTIIRKMGRGYKDNDGDHVTLERYLFDGEDAIAVKLEGSQIGNIPKDELPYMIANWDNYYRVDGFEVKGYDTLGVELRIAFRGTERR